METLILGNVLIISEKSLERIVLDFLIQHGFNSLDEFYDTYLQEKVFTSTWEQIVDIGKECCRSGNHMGVMSLIRYFDCPEERGVESFLIMNSVFPIRMFLSSNKLLASESSTRAAYHWSLKSNTNVLGILYKLSPKMYTLKPLALWTIIDYSSHTESDNYEIEHFGDYV